MRNKRKCEEYKKKTTTIFCSISIVLERIVLNQFVVVVHVVVVVVVVVVAVVVVIIERARVRERKREQ